MTSQGAIANSLAHISELPPEQELALVCGAAGYGYVGALPEPSRAWTLLFVELFALGSLERDRTARGGWNRAAGFTNTDVGRLSSQAEELQHAADKPWVGMRCHRERNRA